MINVFGNIDHLLCIEKNNIVFLDKLDINLSNNYYHKKYKIRKKGIISVYKTLLKNCQN